MFENLSLPIVAAVLIGGYLLGSIPFGVLITRFSGVGDVRSIGSGNIGATNVLRTGRKDLAALTLLGDGGKGLVAVLIARGLTNRRIAEALSIAEATAAVHVKHILAKLDLVSRAEIAAWTARQDFFASLDRLVDA